MGGACLRPGMVEVMLHRRLMWDDGKGLEDVNDDKSEARVMNVVRVRKLKGREDMGGRWRADVMIENDVKVYEAKERAKVSMVWPVEGSRGKEIDADVVILAMRDKRLDETKMAVWVRVQTAPGAGVQRVGARELVGVEAGTGVALGRVVSLTDFVEDEKVGGDWDTMQEVVELAGGGGIEVANDANGENN
ncbi:hypothetical protein BC936DRAFT_143120 [Jimgerdemannia flammicorona]|uniref:Uncharacterized protein n=2 Tax=Jimgerdemannia flammicorona TaxID=994334 RepID=A0A433PEB7_9FUNG|nr:hypothetical protein BC936DRAFT_143120 [Jimgerdemannia flammicorona]RUS15881.1 hypothetical protein BC938DRAFT_476792 [Jimgerdemannia flammicorona]